MNELLKASLDHNISQRIMRQFGEMPKVNSDSIIESLIMTSCTDNKRCNHFEDLQKSRMPYPVKFLADVLPAVQYVGHFDLELITHGGILANNESNQKKLNDWLERKNLIGQTNGNAIRQALLDSIIYGYSGLRRVGDDVIYISPMRFEIIKLQAFMNNKAVPGISQPFLYTVYNEPVVPVQKATGKSLKKTIVELIKEKGLEKGIDGSFYIGENPMDVDRVFLTENLFCHLRHSDEGDYGVSPLSKDRLRVTAIVDYIANMIDEVDNDGTDYNVYTTRDTEIGQSLSNMISSSSANEIMNGALSPQESRNVANSKMNAATKMAKSMKRSDKTHINLINGNVIEKVEKQPGTVELYRFTQIWNDAKGVVADIYGIAPMLAGSSGGGWSTGMSALIQFTMERTIKPLQQRYAEQLNDMVTSCAGIKGSIKFKEIAWEDETNAMTLKKIASEAERNSAQAKKYLAEAGVADAEESEIEAEVL